MDDASQVLPALDEIEGYSPSDPIRSLYVRDRVTATFDDGQSAEVWAYFYNAPLGSAPRIDSGDYLEHVRVR
jgi:gamma-glutamylcyclotransferase (GGCT)/AIG2-like uncharacterized protein YtfP